VQAAFPQAFTVVGMVGVATMLGVLAVVVMTGRRVRQPDEAATAYSGG